MVDKPVAIIGAGPAGLNAAHELAKNNILSTVFEKSDRVGGISRTETHKGYRFDIGGHRFFTKNQKIQEIWEETLKKEFLSVPRKSKIYYQGKYFNYPLSLFNAVSQISIFENILVILSYLKVRIRPYKHEETFDQWVSNRFGRRLFNIFFKTYTEKVWGIPCNEIKSDWAAQRIKGLSLSEALLNALSGNHNTHTLVNKFHYPSKGSGMMWEQFRKTIEIQGSKVCLHSELIGIKHNGSRITDVCYKNKDQKESTLPVQHLISSIPLPQLISMMDPKPPAKVIAASCNLCFRSFIFVVLIVAQQECFSDQWIYVHNSDVKVGRIQFFNNWSSELIAEPGKRLLGMDYFCNQDDQDWKMSDQQLIDRATQELCRLNITTSHLVEDGIVVREPYAYPIYNNNYDKHLAIIQNYITGFENLQTIGRNGMHRYNNMDHSMISGILAAQNILGASHDLWSINEDKEYLEGKKEQVQTISIPQNLLPGLFTKINPTAFGVAVGVVLGLFVLILTIWPILTDNLVLKPYLTLLKQYFIGYSVTIKGAFIAGGYSALLGFLFGWLSANLRNAFYTRFIRGARKKAEQHSLENYPDYL